MKARCSYRKSLVHTGDDDNKVHDPCGVSKKKLLSGPGHVCDPSPARSGGFSSKYHYGTVALRLAFEQHFNKVASIRHIDQLVEKYVRGNE